MTAIAETDVARRVASVRGDQFYVHMAIACAVVAVVGFAPTYWSPFLRGTLDVAPITHLHALFFYGWLALLIAQTRLAARGQLTRHRELGVAGVALATGMCFVGITIGIHSIKEHATTGFADAARAFSIVPFSGIALFAVLFACSLVNVRRPDLHKRLMLVATISLLQAAVGRWVLLLLAPVASNGSGGPPPVFVTVLPGVISDVLLVVAMLHDRRTLGHVHRIYWISGGALLATQLLRVPISTTTAWTAVANAIVALAP
jgi:hypothetical protein